MCLETDLLLRRRIAWRRSPGARQRIGATVPRRRRQVLLEVVQEGGEFSFVELAIFVGIEALQDGLGS